MTNRSSLIKLVFLSGVSFRTGSLSSETRHVRESFKSRRARSESTSASLFENDFSDLPAAQ